MGNVYRAGDAQTGDTVAVKALKSEVVSGDPHLVERFIREGQALHQLNHPNIVKMLAAAEEDGQHYLVMEYVQGGSLRDLLEKQPQLPITQVVEIALDLADALTRAHRLNIIHRDLKPANVMLATDGSVRLTDFGLAHFKSQINLTTAGAVLGTPAYMSPEITMGEPASEGSDIWSYGVILYEMLAGERPFQRNNPAALLMALLTDPVPDLTSRRSDVPEALLDLVYRMLDKNPGSRIPSVRLVGLELEALLKSDGISPPAVSGRVRPTSREPSISAFASPTPPASEPRHNLPVQTTPFVGRERELSEVANVLNEAGCQLVTLLGPGGVGKSRLSIEAASRQFELYADGVYFVPLAPLTSADSIVVTTGEAIHFSFVHPRDPVEQLLDYLRDKQMLLVMDNFEHLLAGASLITAIIQVAAGVKVIATSRVRLSLQAECLYEVGEMSFPNGTDDIAFEDFEAIQLFLTYARRAQPGYELGLKDQPAVAHICQLVDGMPLGIELAAAWVRMLPLAEIATELEGDLDLLETTMQDVPERQRSMRAAFDYSWNLLSAAEQDTFKKLSVFRGGFSRDAARHITGASLMALMGLIDKSLLRRTPGGRFEIHELTRQYGAEKLAAHPQQKQAVQDLHCDYYATMLELQEQFLTRGGRSDEDVQDHIKSEIENIRKSWNWAIIRGKTEALSKSVFALAIFHEYQGTHHSLTELVGPAIEKLESTAPQNESNLILGKL
jgi:non-specific serine/threonine protein kinase